jgi:diguanylate cyclase (GGDEF)-like protein
MFSVIAWMGRRINDLEARLRRQSTTDQLTNVFNRRGLDAVGRHLVHNAARRGTGLLVLFLDLDGLKRINDTLGHDGGSDLIRRFADLLVASFRRNDLIARVGGDEFIVVAEGDPALVPQLLQRLEQNVAADNAGAALGEISYSVGHTEVASDATDLDAAIARADKMMYLHKIGRKAGRSGAPPKESAARPAAVDARIA